MSFVKCSVNGCNQRLQPILKVDPRDRNTWFYRECDVCHRPACEKHSMEEDRRIICDRCRREPEAQRPSEGLIDLAETDDIALTPHRGVAHKINLGVNDSLFYFIVYLWFTSLLQCFSHFRQ
jgi:hypothetical protein